MLALGYLRFRRRERPDIFLGCTIKPNIFGTLAGHVLGIHAINNVAGLGTAFLANGWLARTAKFLYRIALSRSCCVFFQNSTDTALFIDADIVRSEKTQILPGSGVNLYRFSPAFFKS